MVVANGFEKAALNILKRKKNWEQLAKKQAEMDFITAFKEGRGGRTGRKDGEEEVAQCEVTSFPCSSL